MDYDYTATYSFTHKKSGRKVIAQNWKQFYKLQRDQEYIQSYRRLGIGEFRLVQDNPTVYHLEEKVNNFWKGAVGYEKYGEIDCTGVTFNPLRIVLKNILNHAAMQGDKELYHSVKEFDKRYWHNGSAHQLLLTT